MRWTVRIISALFVMTSAYIWTVGQTGLDITNRNLCELWARVWHQAPASSCELHEWIPAIWIVGFLAALVFLLFDFGRWIKSKLQTSDMPQTYESLQYLEGRDVSLGPAIVAMARQSAWGRWYAAQLLVNNGTPVSLKHLYDIAAGKVMDEIRNGNLEVRGRRPDPQQLEYETIDRTHWRSSQFMFVPDPVSLWRLRIVPAGGVEYDDEGNTVRADDPISAERTSLLNYDSLLVDAYQFERLFPLKQTDADEETSQFLRQARRRKLDKSEISRLSLATKS